MASILVVDDDRSVRELLEATLAIEGHEIRAAADGYEALEMLKRDPDFDVAVVDWMMPGLDGLEVIAAIRADERIADLPVVMLTARQDAEHEALAGGADAYMTKPFNPLVLEAHISLLLLGAEQPSRPRVDRDTPAH